MIKYLLSKNADIMFIGINPHFGSYRRGIPFSNNKTLWYLFSRAGLIKEDEDFLRVDENLKKVYEKEFVDIYNLNFTNLIERPSRDVSDLKKGEEVKGKEYLMESIIKYRPKVACFIGKVTYEKFSGEKLESFGWNGSIGKSKVYVMHFPIRGPAAIRVDELKEIMQSIGRNPIGN
ncbi:uracil-DNA glycosylase [Candidatus Mancarchaeum acidiphilum]|uniref:Uracil-DNA glycosylase n=1 Tax=Candidatus Mancarchaeum acidiphilum TaxID=1920749 RepID=A0A218NMZ4_9ARCH|nr:uracil-DNA glycosylase family protein [Candidatus Mancarchaeum acidiphilum]ASI13831.1 uracil-DNA glycosylase [Candidatus Mancarchaeum acidiphilum]